MPWIPNTQVVNSGGSGDITRIFDSILGAPAASIDTDPTSLGGYLHLMGVLNARSDSGAGIGTSLIRLNNDSGNNYGRQISGASGGSLVAAGDNISTVGAGWIGDIPGSTAAAGLAGAYTFWIENYLGTAFNKMIHATGGVFWEGNARAQENTASIWVNTAAVTRIQAFPPAGNFVAGSRLTIYGLK